MHWKLCWQHLKCFSFDPWSCMWRPVHQHALVWHLDESHRDGQRGRTHRLVTLTKSQFQSSAGTGVVVGTGAVIWDASQQAVGLDSGPVWCLCVCTCMCLLTFNTLFHCSQPLLLTPLSITFRMERKSDIFSARHETLKKSTIFHFY